MPWNWMNALQGALVGLARAGGHNIPWPQTQTQISPENQLLSEWARGGIIKPERAIYWLNKNKEGMSSADILKNLTEQDFASKKTADQAKREAEGLITQRMGEVLAGQTQRRAGQQAGAVNQMLQQGQPPQQQLPIGGQSFDPTLRVQSEGLVPLQQKNLIELLQQGGAAGASLNDILATQKLFPQTLTAPEPIDALKGRELDIRERYLKKEEGAEGRREEELKLKKKREQRIKDFAQKSHDLDVKKYSLSNQRLLFEIDEAGKAAGFKAMTAIAKTAKNIAGPGESVTEKHTVEAVKRLVAIDPIFKIIYDRAVKTERGWLGEKEVLRSPEEITAPIPAPVPPMSMPLDNLIKPAPPPKKPPIGGFFSK